MAGDGKMPARDSSVQLPIMGFPGHWAPNDLLFMKEINFLNIISMVRSLLFMALPTGHPIRRQAILFVLSLL